jgi:hypothetical protein
MLFLLLLASASNLVSDDDLYCRKVHDRAWADAAPLIFPELVSEAFRVPNGTVDPQLSGGEGTYQLRVGLAYAPTDIYRGAKTLRVASADCALQASRLQMDEAMPAAGDIGKNAALQKQANYLDEQREQWRRIEKTARERLAVRGITFTDFDELKKRVTQLERKRAQVRGELERIRAEQLPAVTRPLAAIASAYAERSAAYEREADDARFAQAWQFRITGGVVPLQLTSSGNMIKNNRVDWYGLVELRIRLGAAAGDGGYLRARADEVQAARYEIPQKIAELRSQLVAALREAREELAAVNEQLRSTHETITLLEHSDADRAAHAVAMLSLDVIDFASDSLYLHTLIEELAAALGERA